MVVTLGTDITGNWTSGVQSVGGTNALRVQVRGTGFDGSIDISQGASKAAMMVTKQSGALTGYTAATEYYDLRPSAYVKVDITLSAGVIDEVLLAWSGRW